LCYQWNQHWNLLRIVVWVVDALDAMSVWTAVVAVAAPAAQLCCFADENIAIACLTSTSGTPQEENLC
jgi:hypothetical protein